MEIMDQSLMDLQDLFQNLKEGCDNLGTVLEEFGYRYEERNENHLRYCIITYMPINCI